MAGVRLLLSFACLVVLPASGASTSAQIFPALRKRLEAKQLAATQTHAEVSTKAQVPESAQPAEKGSDETPVAVPSPLDVGADGYPKLPAVSQMLSAASGTLKSVNSQASVLEARMVQAQMLSEGKMAKQKAAFEQKLKEQETQNRRVIEANANITTEIQHLQQSNDALRKHAREIQETNHVMRSELHTLQARLGVAKDFTTKSLTSTDDSKSIMLQVLKSGARQRHGALVETSSRRGRDDEDDEEDSSANSDEEGDKEDSDEEDEGTSFLQRASDGASGAAAFEAAMNDLESAVPATALSGVDTAASATDSSSPGDLLDVLSKQVANLAAQEKASEKALKNLFIRDFRAGAKRHSALLAQQKGLVASRSSLLALQAKLKAAETHLESTRKQLQGRLHSLGQFLQKLAHFAMAPQREVPRLLNSLPKAVAMKAEKLI